MNKGVLPAPEKHVNIPVEALWLAGEGAGSWFSVQPFGINYMIFRYSPEGTTECSGIFKIAVGVGFNISNPYQITYPSHCNMITLIQNERKIVLKLLERISINDQ
jgi:hypothetical protein